MNQITVISEQITIYISNAVYNQTCESPLLCWEHYDSVIEIQVVPRGNNTPNDSEENVRESIVTSEKQTSRKQQYITITPRKQAKYVSPPKRIVTRKRKANPDKWQKNVRKRLRQAGSEYTDTKGKIVEAREMKDVDCNKCRFECSLNV
jgi:hypothetical protein